MIELMHGDCLDLMRELPDRSVDLILCDLPYGTTEHAWDSVLPFVELWAQYERVIKANGAIVLTASQPFTALLIASNLKRFKYCWIWEKNNATGFANAKKRPVKVYEDVCVFSPSTPRYYPQGLTELKTPKKRASGGNADIGGRSFSAAYEQTVTGYPKNILKIASEPKGVHPTQKPVALMEYLIKTYTNEGDTVLDNCMGSGTTGVACMNTYRRFIGMEKEASYFAIAKERIQAAFDLVAGELAG